MRMLPFPVSMTEKGDSTRGKLWFFNERLNNSQFKGFGEIP